MHRLLIVAPNWLGDAVMALPAIADVRRAMPGAAIAVAARPAVAPIFALVPDVDDSSPAGAIGAAHGVALLLPNSFHSAWTAFRARIPERWGYRTDWRGRLLTRAIDAPAGVHQVEYYQHLARALGFPSGPIEPRLTVSADRRAAAADALAKAGWNGQQRLAAIAPGAAYGGAKRWPPKSFGELAAQLADDGVRSVVVGSGADRATAGAVLKVFRSLRGDPAPIDLTGRTDLPMLAGVLTHCRALVTNDSGAMHVAAAVGVPVTAVFGPTDESATRPIGDAHRVITHPVWCRPCMLRECPIDHRCMRRIAVTTVVDAARRTL
ncbi:MAG TPA: lipopolysaccharide heptosyltransferase II [Vicinamibacterales bacterium]|nr:lipopolysaccharide heptosyltransferase II [Vicinamibacterales bacterium]